MYGFCLLQWLSFQAEYFSISTQSSCLYKSSGWRDGNFKYCTGEPSLHLKLDSSPRSLSPIQNFRLLLLKKIRSNSNNRIFMNDKITLTTTKITTPTMTTTALIVIVMMPHLQTKLKGVHTSTPLSLTHFGAINIATSLHKTGVAK